MIVLFANQKGGVGKTSILWNLIVEFSKEIKSNIKVIDIDNERKSFQMLSNVREKNQLSCNYKLVDNISTKTDLIDFYNNYKAEDLVFIDSGGIDNDINAMSVYLSDFLICPTSEKLADIKVTKQFLATVDKISEKANQKANTYDKKTVHILFNNIESSKKNIEHIKSFFESLQSSYNYINIVIIQNWIVNTVGFDNAEAEGKSVVELNTNSITNPAKNSFLRVRDEIRKLLNL
ncbi:MAG: ParA family protein [Candidatus Muirbacterium halophilum]|nr:ParA family protein [Candidatus Muirbacterium halophilum]